MAENSGSGAILGVLVGALIVVGVLFFAFGGTDLFRGGDSEIDVQVDVPDGPNAAPANPG